MKKQSFKLKLIVYYAKLKAIIALKKQIQMLLFKYTSKSDKKQ